jgi:hypothetical protein
MGFGALPALMVLHCDAYTCLLSSHCGPFVGAQAQLLRKMFPNTLPKDVGDDGWHHRGRREKNNRQTPRIFSATLWPDQMSYLEDKLSKHMGI